MGLHGRIKIHPHSPNCLAGNRSSLNDQAGLTRKRVVVREFPEHQLEHRVLVVVHTLRIEEVGVVDQSTIQVVQALEELEIVRTNTDELHENRQLTHLCEVIANVVFGPVIGLAIRDEERICWVRRRSLYRERAASTALTEETATTAADVGIESCGLNDPAKSLDVVSQAPAVAAVLIDEIDTVAKRHVSELVDIAVKERNRYFAVVIEQEAGCEAEVHHVLHESLAIQILRRT